MSATIALVLITFFAAVANGGLGYGFSSLTLPIALLYFPNKVMGPALVLVELAVNGFVTWRDWESAKRIARSLAPILFGLLPGILLGSYILANSHPGWLKLATYAVLLPLILLQAGGWRRPFRSLSASVGIPFGAGVGTLYAATTISGPPLALMFNNQGLTKEEFRGALGVIRIVETVLTAILYASLGLHTEESWRVLCIIAPGVMIGLPLGSWLAGKMPAETFRRICMSFDAWIVGFGLARVILELNLANHVCAYAIFASVLAIDFVLLYRYFMKPDGVR